MILSYNPHETVVEMNKYTCPRCKSEIIAFARSYEELRELQCMDCRFHVIDEYNGIEPIEYKPQM